MYRNPASRLGMSVACLCVCVTAFTASAIPPIEKVFVTGDPAPGFSPDYGFAHYRGAPAINNLGQVVFHSNIFGPDIEPGLNDECIWAGDPNNLVLTARVASQAPGTPAGVVFSSWDSSNWPAIIDQSGNVGVWALLSGPGVTASNDAGIWVGLPGSLALAAREGSQAPGTAAGVVWSSINQIGVVLAGGSTSFFGNLTGPGVTGANNSGIWTGPAGGLGLSARTGSQAPGFPVGVNFGLLTVGPFGYSGGSLFSAILSGTGIGANNDSTLWQGASGSAALILQEGSQAPGLPAGVTLSGLTGLNSAGGGAPLFVGGLSGTGVVASNNQALYAGLALIARKGDQAPGAPAGAVFSGFSGGLVHGGNVTFRAPLTGAAGGEGIWSGPPGGISLVARTGTQAPGLSVGVTFGSFSAFANRDPAGNASGLIAFGAQLSGVPATADMSLWAGTPGDIQLLLRENDQFEVSPGNLRTVSQLLWFAGGSSGEDGKRTCLNDDGDLVFSAAFTNNSSGVFIAHLATTCSGQILGDMNGDSSTNGGDMQAFVNAAIISSTNPLDVCRGDFSGNGMVEDADVPGFTTALLTAP